MKNIISKKNGFLAVLIILVLSLGSFGCTYGFPEEFDKDECITKCEEIIEVANTQDFEKLHSMLREDMQDNVEPADFTDAWGKKFEVLGEFEKFGTPVLSGDVDPENGAIFAMIAYYCYYENGEAVFTIFLDTDMEMTSIALKLD